MGMTQESKVWLNAVLRLIPLDRGLLFRLPGGGGTTCAAVISSLRAAVILLMTSYPARSILRVERVELCDSRHSRAERLAAVAMFERKGLHQIVDLRWVGCMS